MGVFPVLTLNFTERNVLNESFIKIVDKIYKSASEVGYKMRKMGKVGTVTNLLLVAATLTGLTLAGIYGPERRVTEGKQVETFTGNLVIEDKVRWDFYDQNDDGKIDLAYRAARGLETEFKGEDAQKVLESLEARCAEYKKNPGPEICF